MNTIELNTWYNLYQVFGDNLFNLDRHWIKEDSPEKRLEAILLQDPYIASFKGYDFVMQFGSEHISLEKLSRTPEGKRIYYPVDTPTLGDMEGVHHGKTEHFRTRKFAEVIFGVSGIPEEDRTGEQYRYKLILRSDNGSFISEAEVGFDEKDNTPYGYFLDWYPENSVENGELCLPLDYHKVARIEIMLTER